MKKKGRVAVFLSGRGSNFLAIYRASKRPGALFRVALVFSDNPQAAGISKAKKMGIPCFAFSPREFPSKEDYEEQILKHLLKAEIDLICLAGYMRLVGNVLLTRFANRIMNIHPALLPSFAGLQAQRQALDYGAKVSGCTVHFVDAGTDTGPIIMQQAVAIKESDNEETLSQRILGQEHRVYPRAVQLYFGKRLKIDGRWVIILDHEN